MARKARKQESDDIVLNLEPLKALLRTAFSSKALPTLAVLALLITAFAITWSIRMEPQSLPMTERWALQSIENNIKTQISQQVLQQYPNLPPTQRDAEVNKQYQAWFEQNKAQLPVIQKQLSAQYKEGFRYTEENGKNYTYLGDLDSYFWLRYARNYLRFGMTCTHVTDGECRDSYPLAPVGVPSSYNPSLHVFATVYLYKFLHLFDPDWPLLPTAYFIPVIFGALAVIPAFFIGRRLAGNVAGFFAAIVIALQPLLLSRSMGSDNDVWNVTLPLFIMWMVIEALEGKKLWKRALFGALAGCFVMVHAATWEGWWFIYLIVLFGLVADVLYRAFKYLVHERKPTVWHDAEFRLAGVVLISFYVAALLFLLLIGKLGVGAYLHIPLSAFSSSGVLDRAVIPDYWPNVLTTVAELNKSSFLEGVGQMGGTLYFFVAMIGLLLLLLPRKRLDWAHVGVLALGALVSLYLLNNTKTKLVTLALIIVPVALAVLLDLYRKGRDESHLTTAFIVLVWFLATVFAMYSGVRFALLMIPAWGIAFAVAIGRTHEWTVNYLNEEFSWSKLWTGIALFFVLALLLIQPVRSAQGTAGSYAPSMDDAWWDSLSKIRENSAPDAIINSWWDFGHWFKYVADRRVSGDGTTQHTHVPRWLGLSLVTPNEDEAMGVLRMLDCGSDAYPNIEGDLGAYGKIKKRFNDSIRSEALVRELVLLETDDEALDRLAAAGFSSDEARNVLASVHCVPPEDYLITSGDMVSKAGVWAHFGLWNFTRAYAIQHSANLPRDEAVADLRERFGMDEATAFALFSDARSQVSEPQKNAFVSPWPGYVTQNWASCRREQNGSIVVCPLGVSIGQQGSVIQAIEAFVYNVSEPNASTLMIGAFQNGQRIGANPAFAPGALVVATNETLVDVISSRSGIGVLYDAVGERVLVADPLLLKSMFTQLYYLDARYNEHFVKFDDRVGITGVRVVIWKVDWEGKA